MNSIVEFQNKEPQLQQLAAQRQLYSTAKRIFGWQMFIGGLVPACLAFTVLFFPSVKVYAALWGVLVSVSDLSWLTPWQKRVRAIAAQIQEQFDCTVLSLPWNDVKVGKQPHPELVVAQANKYSKRSAKMPPLVDWYSKEVIGLPLPIARLICQRQNCWWDAEQRRRYAVTIVGSVLVVLVSTIVLAIVRGFKVEDLLIGILVPLAPALLLGYRQFTEQTEAATRLDSLRSHTERLWADALGGASAQVMTDRSRMLQDEIYDSRKRSPLVFDFIFKLLRKDYELLMNHGAAHYASEVRQRLALAGRPS